MRATTPPVLMLLFFLLACGGVEATEPEAPGVVPGEDVIATRVAEAEERLRGHGEAGQRALAAIAAHGGLPRWYANGPLYFRFEYRPKGRPAIDTYQLVDTWSSRARHWLADDTTTGFGWTGETAWRTPPGADLPTNARFWALTPYYFVGVPFVMGDAGVLLAPGGTMDFEGRSYDLVRMTFAEGTGDAPDDYYIVLIDQETDRVGGVRYVVSYPGFYPDGGHGEEKMIVYDGAQTVGGITLPETFRTFAWTGEAPGDLVTETTMSDVAFRPNAPDSAFAAPPGAELLPGY